MSPGGGGGGGGCPVRPRHRAVPGPWSRGLLLAVALMLVLAGSAGSMASVAAANASATTGAIYGLPLAGPLRVLRPFEPPPTPYAAGHRGVDLDGPTGAAVRSEERRVGKECRS